jgi:hypothetical protein
MVLCSLHVLMRQPTWPAVEPGLLSSEVVAALRGAAFRERPLQGQRSTAPAVRRERANLRWIKVLRRPPTYGGWRKGVLNNI